MEQKLSIGGLRLHLVINHIIILILKILFKFDDVLKYRPINDLYNKLIEDKVWFTSNAQKQLVDEIRKMLIMGHASLPNNIIKESHFGNFENKLITSFWQKNK